MNVLFCAVCMVYNDLHLSLNPIFNLIVSEMQLVEVISINVHLYKGEPPSSKLCCNMSAFCLNSEHYPKATYLHIPGGCEIVNLGVIDYLQLASHIPF